MSIYLPRFEGQDALPVSATILERVVAKASNPATILVVDDEEAIRLLLSEVLTEAGYRVLEAPDASGALTVVVSNARLDLLITDIGLPGGMDGHRLAALARQMREDLAIVLISGHGEIARDQQSGHDMHLLRKPFLMEELTSTVSHLLSGAV